MDYLWNYELSSDSGYGGDGSLYGYGDRQGMGRSGVEYYMFVDHRLGPDYFVGSSHDGRGCGSGMGKQDGDGRSVDGTMGAM